LEPVAVTARRRMLVRAAVVAGVLSMAVAAGVVVAVNWSDEEAVAQPDGRNLQGADTRLAELLPVLTADGWGDPRTLPVPDPEDQAAVREWFTGPGGPVLALVDATEQLWVVGIGTCPEVTSELEAAGSPEALLAAASGAPDATTGELLSGLHTATGQALETCPAGGGATPVDSEVVERALAELAWQWTLTDRHIDALGVR